MEDNDDFETDMDIEVQWSEGAPDAVNVDDLTFVTFEYKNEIEEELSDAVFLHGCYD